MSGKTDRWERKPRMAKRRRGAGALLGVLLLASLAGAALAVHYEARAAERAVALDRAAGRVFAGWVQAAHRATQAHAAAFVGDHVKARISDLFSRGAGDRFPVARRRALA